MSNNGEHREDGGYGAPNLVGSDESGLRAAQESRDAVREARERATDEHGRDRPSPDAGAVTRASGDSAQLDDASSATRASAGLRDADRDPRDDGNSLRH